MINWPAVSLGFGQGALFATAQVNFPEEGAERSRPPKGQVPIRPGAETQARGRPAGGSTKRAVLPALPISDAPFPTPSAAITISAPRFPTPSRIISYFPPIPDARRWSYL